MNKYTSITVHYKNVNVWSLIASAREFHDLWQPHFAVARKSFDFLEWRLRTGTLKFEPGTPSTTLMSLPAEMRLYILELLAEELKQEYKWKRDDFNAADYDDMDYNVDLVDCDRPNFDAERHMCIWAKIFCQVFGYTGEMYMESRFLQESSTGCPCHFPHSYVMNHRFYVDWRPVAESKCQWGLCDPVRHWQDVETYFDSELRRKDEKVPPSF
jgi:hypothetical protein